MTPALGLPLASHYQAALALRTARDDTSRSRRIARTLLNSSEARPSAMTTALSQDALQEKSRPLAHALILSAARKLNRWFGPWHGTQALHLTIYGRLVYQAVIEPRTSVQACDSKPRVSRWNGKRPQYEIHGLVSVYDLQGWDRKAMAHILAVLSGGYNAHFS